MASEDVRARIIAETKEAQKNLDKLQKSFDDLEKELKGTEKELKDYEKSSERAAKSSKDLDKSVGGIGASFKQLAGGIAVGSLVAGAIIGIGQTVRQLAGEIKELALTFQTNMTKIVALVGVPREQVEAWKNDLRSLAPVVGKTLGELSEGLFFVTSAGFRGSDAIDVLTQSAKASTAGLGEIKSIADLVTSAVNAYGIENLSAADATDILVSAVREGKAEAPDFAASLGQVLPVASNMGVEFHEVAAAIASMTRTGSNAAEATTQLRAIMTGLLKPTSEAEKALAAMGTSSSELRRILREDGLLAALAEIKELTEEYGEEVLSTVFPNVRALAGAMDLLGGNADATAGIFDSLKNSTGATETAFEETIKDVEVLGDRVRTRLAVAFESLASKTLPAVAGALGVFDKILAGITGTTENARSQMTQLERRYQALQTLLDPSATSWEKVAANIALSSEKMGDAGTETNALTGAMSGLKNETSEAARLWAEAGKQGGAVDTFFGSIIAGLKGVQNARPTGGFAALIPEGAIDNNQELRNELERTEKQIEAQAKQVENLRLIWGRTKKQVDEVSGDGDGGGFPELEKSVRSINDVLEDQIQQLEEENRILAASEEERDEVKKQILLEKGAREDLVDQLIAEENLTKRLKGEKELEKQTRDLLIESLTGYEQALKRAQIELEKDIQAAQEFARLGLEAAELFDLANQKYINSVRKIQEDRKAEIEKARKQAEEEAQKVLDEMNRNFEGFEVFVGNILTNINDFFFDAFDNIGDGWDGLLDAMLDSFKQLAAAIITQGLFVPIVTGVLGNGQGGGGILGGGGTGGGPLNIGGVFDLVGGIGGSIGAGLAQNPFTAGGIVGGPIPTGASSLIGSQTASGAPGFGFQLGQFAQLGAPLIGAALGALFGGVEGALQGGFAGAGSLAGSFLASTSIGSALGGTVGTVLPVIGTILGSVIGSLLGKAFSKPTKIKLGIEGTVEDILAGQGTGISKALPDELEDTLGEAVTGVLDVFVDTLSDIPEALDVLLNSEIDILTQGRSARKKRVEAILKGGFIPQLFEDVEEAFVLGFQDIGFSEQISQQFTDQLQEQFDEIANNKDLSRVERAEAFTQLIDGFIAGFQAIDAAFEAIPEEFRDKAEALVEGAENLQEAGEQVGAFAQLIGLLDPNIFDPITTTIRQLKEQGEDLGFDGIPTLDEFNLKIQEMIDGIDTTALQAIPALEDISVVMRDVTSDLELSTEEGAQFIDKFGDELLENAGKLKLDPEIVQSLVEYRNALLSMRSALSQSIASLVSFIDQLNDKIVDLGGSTIDVSGALNLSIDNLVDLIDSGNLSFEETEQALQLLDSQVDQFVQSQIEQERQFQEAQSEQFQSRIASLERERELEAEFAQERLDELNEALNVAEALTSIAKSIEDNIKNLLLGPGSIESPFQRLQRAQQELVELQARFATSAGEERVELASEIQDLFNTVLSIGGEAFDSTSLEFADTFRQVISGLEDLQAQVEPTRSIEQINQEIAEITFENERHLRAIDSEIQALRQQSQQFSQQSIQISGAAVEQAREYYEFIREQALELLDQRLEQLAELGIEDVGALSALEAIEAESLTTLREIRDALQGVIPAASGFSGVVDRPQLFLAGEQGPEMVNITPLNQAGFGGDSGVNLTININNPVFDSSERVREVDTKIRRAIEDFELRFNYGQRNRRNRRN